MKVVALMLAALALPAASRAGADSSVLQAAGLQLAPPASDERYGAALASLSDLDRDGDAWELAVGAPGANSAAGAVYVQHLTGSGASGPPARIPSPGGVPAVSAGDMFGTSLAFVGDLSGNGKADTLAVGAPGDDTSASDSGAVYVLTLTTSGAVSASLRLPASTIAPGAGAEAHVGASLSLAGDLTMDGIASDVLVGAPSTSSSATAGGMVALVSLSRGGGVNTTRTILTAGPGEKDAEFGASVAFLGDADGDGLARDIAVGAPSMAVDGVACGAVVLVSLDAELSVMRRTTVYPSGQGPLALVGLAPGVNGQRFGHAVASLAGFGGPSRVVVGSPGGAGGAATGLAGGAFVLSLSALLQVDEAAPLVNTSLVNTSLVNASLEGGVVGVSFAPMTTTGEAVLMAGTVAPPSCGQSCGGGEAVLRLARTKAKLPGTAAEITEADRGIVLGGRVMLPGEDDALPSLRLEAPLDRLVVPLQLLEHRWEEVTIAAVMSREALVAARALGGRPSVSLLDGGGSPKSGAWAKAGGAMANRTLLLTGLPLLRLRHFHQSLRVHSSASNPPDATAAVQVGASSWTIGRGTVGSKLYGKPGRGFTVDGTINRATTTEELGVASVSLGDLNGDGFMGEFLITQPGDFRTTSDAARAFVLYVDRDGNLVSVTDLMDGLNGIPSSFFGTTSKRGASATFLGDLDGDGFAGEVLLAGKFNSAVLWLRPTGSVRKVQTINQAAIGVCFAGDVDGDGAAREVLFVGKNTLKTVWLTVNGTVDRVSAETGGSSPYEGFLNQFDFDGDTVAPLGNLNGDGRTLAFAIGSSTRVRSSTGVYYNLNGKVHIVSLSSAGTVQSITSIERPYEKLAKTTSDAFGSSVAFLGDIDGDGSPRELAVGADLYTPDNDYQRDGAIYILWLTKQGAVRHHVMLSKSLAPLPRFTWAVGGSLELLGTPSDYSSGTLALTTNQDRFMMRLSVDMPPSQQVLVASAPEPAEGFINGSCSVRRVLSATGGWTQQTLLLPSSQGSAAVRPETLALRVRLPNDAVPRWDGRPATPPRVTIGGSPCRELYWASGWHLEATRRDVVCVGLPSSVVSGGAVSVEYPGAHGSATQLIGPHVASGPMDASALEPEALADNFFWEGEGSNSDFDNYGSCFANLGSVSGKSLVFVGMSAQTPYGHGNSAGYGMVYSTSDGDLISGAPSRVAFTSSSSMPTLPADARFGDSCVSLQSDAFANHFAAVVGAPGTPVTSNASTFDDTGRAFVVWYTGSRVMAGDPTIIDVPVTSDSLGSRFASSAARLGPAHTGGVDVALGAPTDSAGASSSGAVHIFTVAPATEVPSATSTWRLKIANGLGGMPSGSIPAGAWFGASLVTMRDRDGDNTTVELAVGAPDFGAASGAGPGAVYMLQLLAGRSVGSFTRLEQGVDGFASLGLMSIGRTLLDVQRAGPDWTMLVGARHSAIVKDSETPAFTMVALSLGSDGRVNASRDGRGFGWPGKWTRSSFSVVTSKRITLGSTIAWMEDEGHATSSLDLFLSSTAAGNEPDAVANSQSVVTKVNGPRPSQKARIVPCATASALPTPSITATPTPSVTPSVSASASLAPSPASTPPPSAPPSPAPSSAASAPPSAPPSSAPSSAASAPPSAPPSSDPSSAASAPPSAPPSSDPSSPPDTSEPAMPSSELTARPSLPATATASPAASVDPSVSASPSVAPSPSATPQPVSCVISHPAVSACSADCGDGGVRYTVRRILALPQNGGAACPPADQLVTSVPCNVSGLPACPVDAGRCSGAGLLPCGSGTDDCGLCASGRGCGTDADCAGDLVCRARGGSGSTLCLGAVSANSGGGSGADPSSSLSLAELFPPLRVPGGAVPSTLPVSRPPAGASEPSSGLVVQTVLTVDDASVLSLEGVLDAMLGVLVDLVGSVPSLPEATVRGDAVVTAGVATTSRLRRAQSGPTTASASGATVTVTMSVTAPSAGRADAWTESGRRIVSELGADRPLVEAAVLAAMIGANPAAGAVSVSAPSAAEYAVVSSADGAVIGSSAGLRAAIVASSPSATPTPSSRPTTSTSPAPSNAAGGVGGDEEPGPVAGAVVGGVAAVALAGVAVWCWRRRRSQPSSKVLQTYKPSIRKESEEMQALNTREAVSPSRVRENPVRRASRGQAV